MMPPDVFAVGFELRGLPEVQALLARFTQPQLGQRLRWAAERTAAKVLADAAEDVDRDTGVLAESLQLDVWGDGLDVWGAVFTTEAYGIVREFGRRPGQAPPPEGALLGWMSRHPATGIYANLSERAREDALRWGIAIKGSPPHPFLRPALWANRRFAVESAVLALTSPSLPGVQSEAA